MTGEDKERYNTNHLLFMILS